MNVKVPKLVGETSDDGFKLIVAKFADKLMYEALGVKAAVIGHTIEGLAF